MLLFELFKRFLRSADRGHAARSGDKLTRTQAVYFRVFKAALAIFVTAMLLFVGELCTPSYSMSKSLANVLVNKSEFFDKIMPGSSQMPSDEAESADETMSTNAIGVVSAATNSVLEPARYAIKVGFFVCGLILILMHFSLNDPFEQKEHLYSLAMTNANGKLPWYMKLYRNELTFYSKNLLQHRVRGLCAICTTVDCSNRLNRADGLTKPGHRILHSRAEKIVSESSDRKLAEVIVADYHCRMLIFAMHALLIIVSFGLSWYLFARLVELIHFGSSTAPLGALVTISFCLVIFAALYAISNARPKSVSGVWSSFRIRLREFLWTDEFESLFKKHICQYGGENYCFSSKSRPQDDIVVDRSLARAYRIFPEHIAAINSLKIDAIDKPSEVTELTGIATVLTVISQFFRACHTESCIVRSTLFFESENGSFLSPVLRCFSAPIDPAYADTLSSEQDRTNLSLDNALSLAAESWINCALLIKNRPNIRPFDQESTMLIGSILCFPIEIKISHRKKLSMYSNSVEKNFAMLCIDSEEELLFSEDKKDMYEVFMTAFSQEILYSYTAAKALSSNNFQHESVRDES